MLSFVTICIIIILACSLCFLIRGHYAIYRDNLHYCMYADVLDALDNTHVYTEVVKKVFSFERSTKPLHQHVIPEDLERDVSLETDAREQVIEVAKDFFKKNRAKRLDVASLDFVKHLEIKPLSLQDDPLDLRSLNL